MRLLFGDFADELVVRFDNTHYEDAIVALIATPVDDYAGLVVSTDSGAVIGVFVYPLAAFAVQRHPSWQAAIQPNPPPEVAGRIVRDIKALFDRYGIEPVEPERA